MTPKRLNVGIVGYGWAAEAHLAALNATTNARVAAICSSLPLDPQQLSAKHQCPLKVCRRLEDLLAHRAIDVVDLCSYHHLHPRQVTRSLLDAGLLGDRRYGEVDYYHGIGPWYREYEWIIPRKACGSSLLAAGCHAMDALLLCLGGDVDEVFSYGAQSAHPTYAAYEYPTTTTTLLKFQDGTVGKCASVIDCWQPYYFHTHRVGSEGSLLDNRLHSNAPHGDDRHQWKELPFKPVDSGDVSDHPYQTQFDAFFESLEQGVAMPPTGLKEAVLTHEVIFAADRSLQLGRPVKLAEMRGAI
jgi:predicted dehydrogenase